MIWEQHLSEKMVIPIQKRHSAHNFNGKFQKLVFRRLNGGRSETDTATMFQSCLVSLTTLEQR